VRERLADYIARNSARASTAKQAQSRAKALARMQPIAEMIDDPSLSFEFPNPDALRPPLVTLDLAAVGYGETPVLQRLNLRLDPDDRVALLGRNGNGKTTLARLLAAQLAPMAGTMKASGKMRVGYFTQYQVEELDRSETPLAHMARMMKDASPAAVRAQLGRFGFSGAKATTEVGKLSGGERARLALALITREAPHMLILDEPTNHLDVDTAREFDGSIDDYIALVLAKAPASGGKGAGERTGGARKDQRKAAAEARVRGQELRKRSRQAELDLEKLTAQRNAIDQAMFDPGSAQAPLAKLTMTELMKRRAELETRIGLAEAAWLEASEALEAIPA